MAQMRGNAGYGIGQPNPFTGGSTDSSDSEGALDSIRKYTSKVEDVLDAYSEPIKPYVCPAPFRRVSSGCFACGMLRNGS